MRVTAAVLYATNKPYSVETVELDSPKRGEVLIKVAAAGVCRSDLHFQKARPPSPCPRCWATRAPAPCRAWARA